MAALPLLVSPLIAHSHWGPWGEVLAQMLACPHLRWLAWGWVALNQGHPAWVQAKALGAPPAGDEVFGSFD